MGTDPGWLERLRFDETVKEINRMVLNAVKKSKADKEALEARTRAEARRDLDRYQFAYSLDLSKQAYQLDKTLPRDLNALMGVIKDERIPADRRAKILEVIILRGADNQHSYTDMEKPDFTHPVHPDVLRERREYQAAAFDAVLNGSPALFDQLSRSKDQLPDGPSGRYPATEWMNTMLRQGGLVGTFETRQSFEKWLLELPPEQRGQAMFHVRDAMGARERGDVNKMTGAEISTGPIGFGLSWENAKDTHWDKVGDDVLKPVAESLQKPDEVKAFHDGYRRADRDLPDPGH